MDLIILVAALALAYVLLGRREDAGAVLLVLCLCIVAVWLISAPRFR